MVAAKVNPYSNRTEVKARHHLQERIKSLEFIDRISVSDILRSGNDNFFLNSLDDDGNDDDENDGMAVVLLILDY
jgi:hypothetical protein